MDTGFNLHQRVVLVAGPMSSTVSSVVMGLTRLGADCILLDPDKSVPQAFVNQINDAREVNDKFGRAAILPLTLGVESAIKDLVGKASQVFGGVDIFIDALMVNQPTPLKAEGFFEGLDALVDRHLKSSLILTQAVLAFFKSRKRGRVVFLLNGTPNSHCKEDVMAQGVRSGLIGFAAALGKSIGEPNITVNALTISLTEEYILGHDPASKSIKEAMEKMKSLDATLKITEPDKISQTMGFLVSALGTPLTGQHIVLT